MLPNLLLTRLGECQESDSGWALDKIIKVTFNLNKYTPIADSCSMNTPTFIANKKAVINGNKKDNECLKWANPSAVGNRSNPVVTSRHPVK